MSKGALAHNDRCAERLDAIVRASATFRSLLDGSIARPAFARWLAQTAVYSDVTGSVLRQAAATLGSGALGELAPPLRAHGDEEAEENPVIHEDLAALGLDLRAAEVLPPTATYVKMMQETALHPAWAIGVTGVIRLYEKALAAPFAPVMHRALSASPDPAIRAALRFIAAHTDEAEHLARMDEIVAAAPPASDFAIEWCAEQALLHYQGLLAHLDGCAEGGGDFQ
ncbi:MAG: hypothetical protein JSR82_05650 [Verrucomicrobia bacterium]|nr:hypothetical protein [Verrucomicrobiota bacterium]